MVTTMTKAKKIRKDGLPQEFKDRVLAMQPGDLAVESSREELAIETLKVQLKEDPQISDMQKKLDQMKDALALEQQVQDAKEKLEELKATHADEDMDKVKQDLKALKAGWNKDIKDRKKQRRFMLRCLKKHMESGALKSKTV
jgi:hypothetical protein